MSKSRRKRLRRAKFAEMHRRGLLGARYEKRKFSTEREYHADSGTPVGSKKVIPRAIAETDREAWLRGRASADFWARVKPKGEGEAAEVAPDS